MAKEYKSFSMELAGRTLRVEVGHVAAQANGAALLCIMVTHVCYQQQQLQRNRMREYLIDHIGEYVFSRANVSEIIFIQIVELVGRTNKQLFLINSLKIKQDAVLYENKNKKFTIQDVATKRILRIVLTLNQFGGLAVNTSLILEKEESQPYPWVCNWHDLENIIEILKYLNKEPEDFIDYIIWRIESHPNVLSSDELNVIEGYFMNSQWRKQNGAIFFPANGPILSIRFILKKMPYHVSILLQQRIVLIHIQNSRNTDDASWGSGLV